MAFQRMSGGGAGRTGSVPRDLTGELVLRSAEKLACVRRPKGRPRCIWCRRPRAGNRSPATPQPTG
eukprot:12699328-Alexandrium_andersonii.AAC.1